MRLVIPLQMGQIDRYSINELGIPGIILMENAALRVVEEAVSALGGCVVGQKVLLLAGKGNNGGDAFAVARHLMLKGADTCVHILADKSAISGDAKVNLDILYNIGANVNLLTDRKQISSLEKDLYKSELIIDGIFGTGFKGVPDALTSEIIGMVNGAGKYVIAIDIPSGVNGETGKVPGSCVNANVTVTFQLPKTGLLVHPGCDRTGRLVVADIGIPEKAVFSQNINSYVIDQNDVSFIIPARKNDTNKGSYGKIFILTGSKGMTGSGCLCAKAALRSGAGLVYVGVPSSLATIYGSSLVEPIIMPLEDAGKGHIPLESVEHILKQMEKMDIMALGPGLSVNYDIRGIVGEIIKKSRIPLILDADALNSVADDLQVLNELKAEAVITPHPGEMARLTGLTIDEVQSDRIKVARDFAARWRLIVVLKGSRTIIALPDGTIYINTTGNPGMASGGSGDVLTGIIAGLAGQGIELADAAVAGVYLHGLAGDAAAIKKGVHGLIAGDMVEELPYVIKETVGRNSYMNK
jgi:yjeF C-terminal region, hydroxyethylthiazole kinase-related/yjeF N-terminal region